MTDQPRPARPGALRAILERGEFVVAPGVYEMLGAKIADRMDFHALYMTGYGISTSHLGQPDAGLAGFTDFASRARTIAQGISRPLIADADTGFGGLLNIRHTVRGYEEAGVQAIQLEDQESPKKCGHTPNRRVVPLAEAVRRVEVAVDARRSRDFLIIARTDARTTHGLDEALRRGEAYVQAGADVLFIESPESAEEMARIGRAFDVPLMANMVEGGRTPILSADELERVGYRFAIFPALGFLAAGAALQSAYGELKDKGSSDRLATPLYPFKDFSALMGFDWVAEFDRRHRGIEGGFGS